MSTIKRALTVFSFLLALTLILCWSASPGRCQGGALDGKTFSGEFGQRNKKKEGNDTFIFKDGRFRSTACDPYGFGDAPYTTSLSANVTTFEAQTVSPREGTINWKGTVKGEVLEGTFIWTKPKKKKGVEYWFKATQKK